MMEELLFVLAFFSLIATGTGLMAANTKNEETVAVFGYLSIVLFAVFFGLSLWTITAKESYQESTIMDYCNGKIAVDTVSVTNDGMLYKIKIKEVK